jgi:RNA polymerase-interacting CarD/CdnL/TRCF family regulator
MKFKKGDMITVTSYGIGFENVVVRNIINQDGKQYYVLKIVNGTVTIPVSAECNYELCNGNSK